MSDSIISMTYDDVDVQSRLERLQENVQDLTPAMEDIGEYGLLVTDRRFQTETDPDGKPWQKLSAFTVAKKKAEGKIAGILQRTGLMRSRVNYRASATSCIIGVNDVKAKKHQFGIGVPQRKFLGFSSEDKQEIIAILEDHIVGGQS